MAFSSWKCVVMLTITIATVGNINCLLAEGIPKIISLMDNVNASTASIDSILPQLKMMLNNQENLTNLTNILLKNVSESEYEISSVVPEILEFLTVQWKREESYQNKTLMHLAVVAGNHEEYRNILQNQHGSLTLMTESQSEILNNAVESEEIRSQIHNILINMNQTQAIDSVILMDMASSSQTQACDTLTEIQEYLTLTKQNQTLDTLKEIRQTQIKTANSVALFTEIQNLTLEVLSEIKECQTLSASKQNQTLDTLKEISKAETDAAKNIVIMANQQNRTLDTLIEMKGVQVQTTDNLKKINQQQEQVVDILTQLAASMVHLQQTQESFINRTMAVQHEMVQKLSNIENLLQTRNLDHEDDFQHGIPTYEPVQVIPTRIQQTTSSRSSMMVDYQDCSNTPSAIGVLGEYTIISNPSSQPDPFPVICDTDTSPGGWVVYQRRFDGSVDFDHNWADYEDGFGSLNGDFWLGLQKLYALTSDPTTPWEFRVDLENFDGDRAYAVYDYFRVGSGSSFYRLTIGSYIEGNAGDAMREEQDLYGMAFTTKDQDHDLQERYGQPNCAILNRSGWWYNACASSNVSGLFRGDGIANTRMTWYPWKQWQLLRKTELKIRPVLHSCTQC